MKLSNNKLLMVNSFVAVTVFPRLGYTTVPFMSYKENETSDVIDERAESYIQFLDKFFERK